MSPINVRYMYIHTYFTIFSRRGFSKIVQDKIKNCNIKGRKITSFVAHFYFSVDAMQTFSDSLLNCMYCTKFDGVN